MRLSGKVALITGAGMGNGRGFALGFAREGADVAVVDLNVSAAEETAAKVRELGRRAAVIQADVSRAGDVQRMVDTASSELGGIDVLVNNAGVRGMSALLDITEEEWDQQLDVDLKAPFLCLQAVAKQMIAHGTKGTIINITSMAGLRAGANRAAYCSAKAGLIMLTQAAAIELAQYGIRVNAIAPGAVETPLTAPLRATEQAREAMARLIPMGRWAVPEDLVGPAIFLASEEAGYMTGANLLVDGGWCAGSPPPR